MWERLKVFSGSLETAGCTERQNQQSRFYTDFTEDGTEKSTFALETALSMWRNHLNSEGGCKFTGKLFCKGYRSLEEPESTKLWPDFERSMIVLYSLEFPFANVILMMFWEKNVMDLNSLNSYDLTCQGNF